MDDATPDETTGVPAQRPFLQVVRGNPTDVEVAILTALLAGAAAGGDRGADTSSQPRDDWGRPTDRLRPAWGMPSSFTNLRH